MVNNSRTFIRLACEVRLAKMHQSRMSSQRSRKPSSKTSWPRKIRLGRITVSIYRRKTPTGGTAFMVSNYSGGQRRLDSYAKEADALDAAQRLARQLSERQVVAASLTNEAASNYAAAVQALASHNVPSPVAASTLAEYLRLVGNLPPSYY